MIRIDEAMKIVLSNAECNKSIEIVSLLNATGRVAASNIQSLWNVPRLPTSIKDGFAISFAGIVVELKNHRLIIKRFLQRKCV